MNHPQIFNLNQTRTKFKTYKLLLLSLIATATLFHSAFGQALTARPDRGINTTGSYQASNLDTVNMLNGNVILNIPLASLPPIAGGKLSYTLNAYYNSKLLNVNRNEAKGTLTDLDPENPTSGCAERFTQEEVVASDAGGWKIGGTYQIFFRDAHDDYNYSNELSQTCDGNEVFYMQGKFFKPMLRMPDGSERELRLDSSYATYTGDREHLKNYYKYTGTNYVPTFSSPVRMSTIDGSYLTVVYNPPTASVKWTIYQKDGTQILQNSDGTQRIKDTNGNSILFQSGSIKDEQTGREIKTSQTTYNGQTATKVEYQTVGGTWKEVMVVWGTTDVLGKLYRTQEWDPQASSVQMTHTCNDIARVFQNTFSVVREIILPATESGVAPQKFSFAYNSDTSTQATTQNVKWSCGWNVTGQAYTRTVSPGLGELSEVNTPTGAKIKYSYAWDGVHSFEGVSSGLMEGTFGEGPNELVRNAITKKEIVHDGITDMWQYSIDTSNLSSGGSVTNPDGSVDGETYYENNPAYAGYLGYSTPLAGLNRTSSKGNVTITRNWNTTGTYVFGSVSNTTMVNPLVDTEFTTVGGNGSSKTKATKYQYDANGEVLQTIEYDWFDTPSGTLTIPNNATVLRTINNSYYNQAANTTSSNYYTLRSVGSTPTILGAPQETTVGNSQTRFSYDGQAYGTAPVKGNVTNIARWDSFNNAWLNTGSTYDTYGNVTSTTDAKGGVTQIFYEDATHVMPTKTIVNPQNGSGQQISTATYDFSTGAILSQTDINGNVSNIDYTNLLLGTVDPFARPGTVLSPATNINGTNKRQTAKTYYEDSARKVRTEADLFDQGDGLLKSRVTSDQLGRAVLSEKNENGANAYSIFSQTVYKDMGKIVLQSNPTRGTGESTDGWTRVTKDNLGRAVEAATFSGSTAPPWTGTNSNFTGAVTTLYDANATTVTDQAGKQRRSITNGIGQLVRVDEPDNNGSLGTISSPAQATSYSYDVLGNLTQVNQGAQTRTFTYDSLSRLRQAQNPESGTISYNYDANGNLTSKTDARSIVTNFTYDALNRVLSRSYSDSTPAVAYTYEDANIAYSKGKLTKVSSTVSETRYNSFDNLGKVLSSQQITDGNTFNFGYTYNLSGGLVSENYPSGRVVTNQFQGDGSLAQVNGVVNQTSKTYANNFNYNAVGAVNSIQLGNGRWENSQFNSRLQPTQLGLGTSSTDQSLWKVNYDYENGTPSQNNGNVLKQTITVPSINPLVQTYTYDSLNRLKSAVETSNNQQTWKQTFVYDRYGNRNFDANNTTTIPSGCSTAQCNPTVDAANNRFTTGQGYTYDLSGNLITDAQNRSFIYDAENKQKEVKDASNNSIGQYLYDGDAKRVKKISASDTTVFAYDASGKLAAEYLLTSATQQTPTTSYLTNDTLGSPRVITDQSGNVQTRRDFMPFGEEISGLGNRTSMIGYQLDSTRQKFTGYERDNETDLDFAQARYYEDNYGRFSTADPYNIILESKVEKNAYKAKEKLDAFLYKAQQWNKYSYVANNPLVYNDPTGEILRLTGSKSDNEQVYSLLKQMVGEKSAKNLTYTVEEDGTWTINYKNEGGGLAISSEFGVALEEIIDSSVNVSLRTTLNSIEDTGFGEKVNLTSTKYNGGYTGLGLSGDTISIIIHKNVVNIANKAFEDTGFIGTDGKTLKMSFSAAIAHELGHAWGGIRDNTVKEMSNRWFFTSDLKEKNENKAVQLENYERKRLGMPLRYQHNP